MVVPFRAATKYGYHENLGIRFIRIDNSMTFDSIKNNLLNEFYGYGVGGFNAFVKTLFHKEL